MSQRSFQRSLSSIIVADTSRRILAVALIVLMLLPVAASAQQASSTMGPQFMSGTPGTYAIRNARIVTVSGADIENGTIVIRDGKNATGGVGDDNAR